MFGIPEEEAGLTQLTSAGPPPASASGHGSSSSRRGAHRGGGVARASLATDVSAAAADPASSSSNSSNNPSPSVLPGDGEGAGPSGEGDAQPLPEPDAAPATPQEKKKRASSKGKGRGGWQQVKLRSGRNQKSQGEGKLAHAEQLDSAPKLGWLKDSTLIGDERTIWRVNRTIARSTSVRQALQVVEEMKAAGLSSANEGTYVALITVCRRQKQGERALVVYEAMKQAGVRPSLLTYNLLISCCQQAQRLESAFLIKEDMEAAGVAPDVVTYTSLMGLVTKCSPFRGRATPAQRLSRVLALFQEMQQGRGLQPDAVTFNTLMYAAAQASLPGKVLEIYGQMVAGGVSPNQFTFSILLEAVGQGGRLKAALEVFNEMKAAGVPPQTSTYNCLIDACAVSPQPDAQKAWSLYEEMLADPSTQPNADTLTSLVTACSKGGDYAGALKVHALMRERGFSKALLAAATYNKLIHSADMSGSLDAAFKLYAEMKEGGVKPDAVTYSTLVAACNHHADVQRALAVQAEMEGLGVKPNQARALSPSPSLSAFTSVVVYHSLIGAHGEAGQWREALAVFRQLEASSSSSGGAEVQNCPAISGEVAAVSLGSYSLLFDACFGKGGASAAVLDAVAKGNRLEITEGIKAALDVFETASQAGIFKCFRDGELERCDVRVMTRSSTVVALLAWLERIRASPPIQKDLLVVTGNDKGRGVTAGSRKGRHPKLYVSAQTTLQAVGLPPKCLETITMHALTVENASLTLWLADGVQQNSDHSQVVSSVL
eukprot:jgi/Mesen1/9439/ME000062S08915